MANVDTSIDQLLNIVAQSGGNNQILNSLIKTLHKTIPTQRTKRRIIMADTNLNKVFRIKRINYSVIAKILTVSDNLYNAEILSIDGQSFNKVGDTLTISKRELQLTGHPTSSLK